MKALNEILGKKINVISNEELDTKKAHDEAKALTYLIDKFPNSDSTAFYTDYTGRTHKHIQNASAVCLAADNEKICGNCNGQNCKIKSKPVVKISKTIKGFEFLDVRWTCEAVCKFRPFKNSMIKKSRLYPHQLEMTLENFNPMNKQSLESAINCAGIASQRHTDLIISGSVGVGKTHLAVGILLEVIRQNSQGIFWQAGDLLDELKRLNFEGGHADFVEELKNVPCLVIDDLCRRVPTEPYGSQLFQIIESRCIKRLQTIITTNAGTIEEMRNTLNALWVVPMISRMLEKGAWAAIRNVQDYRLRNLRGAGR